MATLRIAFLGQCLVHGYPGVDRDETFPEILRRRLLADWPGLTPVVSADSYYHPSELPSRIAGVAERRAADVVIVDVAGYFAARDMGAVDLSRLPRAIRHAYERVRHLRAVAKGLLQTYPATAGLVRRIETTGVALADGALRPLLQRYPAPTLREYEALLTDGIRAARRNRKLTIVLQGPGMFNDDEVDRRYAPDTQQIYRAVNAMTRRLADAHRLLFVDRMAVTDSRSVCLPGTIRLCAHGHRVMGDALLASLKQAGVLSTEKPARRAPQAEQRGTSSRMDTWSRER